MTWRARSAVFWHRRADQTAISQVVLSIGLFVLTASALAAWDGYSQLANTRTTLLTTIRSSISTAVITPAPQGGYVTEGLAGSSLELNLGDLVHAAADSAQQSIPHSKVQVGSTGFTWTLSQAQATPRDVGGTISVGPIMQSNTNGYHLQANVSVPVVVPLFGMPAWHTTMKATVYVPLGGQTAPAVFVPYQ